jgi:hypothetical protein
MAKQADMHRRGQSGPGAERVRRALDLVRSGVVFDLDIGRFPGMPRNPAQPAFDVVVKERRSTKTTLGSCWSWSPRACTWGRI